MKFVIALFALSFTIAGCSKSSNNGAQPLSPFQKASNGKWISECQKNGGAGYRDTVVLSGSTGSSTSQYFQNPDCTGAVTKTEDPLTFTYITNNKAGGKEGEASVTFTLQDGQSVTVDVVVQGNTMVITSQTGTVIYQRQGGTPGQQSPQMAAFDAAARGNWITRDCRTVSGGSYYQVLTIKGAGQASVVYNVYNNNDQCQGNPTPQSPSDIAYVVDRYANGGGQLTIDNQTVDVTINGNQMDIISASGTIVFIRIR